MFFDVPFGRLVWLGCGDLATRFQQLCHQDTSLAALRTLEKVGVRRRVDHVPSAFCAQAGDLTEVATWRRVLETSNKDVWVISLTPRQRTEAGYHDGYCLPLQQLGQAMQAVPNRPKRVIFVSSTSVYAQNAGERIDETSLAQPHRFNGQQLVCAEHILQGLAWGAETQVSILRLAGIYGQGRSRLLKKILTATSASELGTLNHFTNRIHSLDAAKIIAHLMRLDRVQPMYVGSDRQSSVQGDVLLWIAERMSEQLPKLQNLQTLVKELRSQSGASEHLQGKQCQSVALQSENFEWSYPHYRLGYAPLIEAFCASVLNEA